MMPFPGGLEATPNATLLFSLAASALNLAAIGRQTTFIRSLIKTLSIFLLAVLAVVTDGPWLLVLGLLLSAAGDFVISREGDRAFMGGLVLFLLVHFAYMALFVSRGEGLALPAAEPWRYVLGLALILAPLALLAVVRRHADPGMKLPVTVYAVVIMAMGLCALTVKAPLVLAGAVLFMISDSILALEKFVVPANPAYTWMQHATWITYYGAQLAITLAFLL